MLNLLGWPFLGGWKAFGCCPALSNTSLYFMPLLMSVSPNCHLVYTYTNTHWQDWAFGCLNRPRLDSPGFFLDHRDRLEQQERQRERDRKLREQQKEQRELKERERRVEERRKERGGRREGRWMSRGVGYFCVYWDRLNYNPNHWKHTCSETHTLTVYLWNVLLIGSLSSKTETERIMV